MKKKKSIVFYCRRSDPITYHPPTSLYIKKIHLYEYYADEFALGDESYNIDIGFNPM